MKGTSKAPAREAERRKQDPDDIGPAHMLQPRVLLTIRTTTTRRPLPHSPPHSHHPHHPHHPHHSHHSHNSMAAMLGVRRRLPVAVIEAGEVRRGPLKVLFLVDVSYSMSGAIAMVRAEIARLLDTLPQGALAAIAWYSDVSDAATYGLACDFTGDREALREAARTKLSLSGGGDNAEAQYTAFAMAARMEGWGQEGGLVVHITDAPPHTLEAERSGASSDRGREMRQYAARAELGGLAYDWFAIARALAARRVMACTFLVGASSREVCLPYYLAMAHATGAPGVFLVPSTATDALAKQVMALVRAVTQAAEAGAVEAETAAGVQLAVADAAYKQRALELDTEYGGTWSQSQMSLYRGSQLSDPVQVATALSDSFAGLTRADGAVKRFAASEGGAVEYEAKLRAAAARLRVELAEALAACPPEAGVEEPVCALSAATQRELVQEFVEDAGFDADAEDLTALFVRMASLMVGAPMHAPFRGGKFNFEDAWVVVIERLSASHVVCYQALLDYLAAVAGGWKAADRAGLARSSAPDLVLRSEGEVTGVLPLPGPGAFGAAVFAALARTPWLAALLWHSVCRHALPPPNVGAGVLGCALVRLLRQAPSEAGDRLIADAVRGLRLLPNRAGKAQAEALDAYFGADGADAGPLRAALSAQSDCPPAKALAALAQCPLVADARSCRGALEALTGELLSARLAPDRCGPAAFTAAVTLVDDLPDMADELYVLVRHPLETGELGGLRAEAPAELLEAATRAEAAARRFLAACGAPVAPLEAGHLRALALEAALLGPGGRAARASDGAVVSKARDTSTGDAALADMLHAVLSAAAASELAGLGARRRRHAVDSVGVQRAAAALGDPRVGADALGALLAAPCVTAFCSDARMDFNDVPAVLAAAGACSDAAKLRLLACGPWPGGEGAGFCKDVAAVEAAAGRWLAPAEAAVLVAELVALQSTLKSGLTPPVAGSDNFNRCLVDMARAVRGALGIPGFPTDAWTCTRALVSQAAAAGLRHAGMGVVREHGDVLFVPFRQDGVERLAAWRVGESERRTSTDDGYERHVWPVELLRRSREAHVRSDPKMYGLGDEPNGDAVHAAVEAALLRKMRV